VCVGNVVVHATTVIHAPTNIWFSFRGLHFTDKSTDANHAPGCDSNQLGG
jgi:hypothetical protein